MATILERHPDRDLRVFVVWEPVLFTDWGRPSDGALALIRDRRVAQVWDRGRALSHALGEKDKHTIVWDWAGIYPAGSDWRKAAFSDGPVAPKAASIEAALARSLDSRTTISSGGRTASVSDRDVLFGRADGVWFPRSFRPGR